MQRNSYFARKPLLRHVSTLGSICENEINGMPTGGAGKPFGSLTVLRHSDAVFSLFFLTFVEYLLKRHLNSESSTESCFPAKGRRWQGIDAVGLHSFSGEFVFYFVIICLDVEIFFCGFVMYVDPIWFDRHLGSLHLWFGLRSEIIKSSSSAILQFQFRAGRLISLWQFWEKKQGGESFFAALIHSAVRLLRSDPVEVNFSR